MLQSWFGAHFLYTQQTTGKLKCHVYTLWRRLRTSCDQGWWRASGGGCGLILNALNTNIDASHIHVQQLRGRKYSWQQRKKMAADRRR